MTAGVSKSAIYEGRVRHRRRVPVQHEFSYSLFLVYLDLGELDEVFRGRWLWSTRRPNLAWFRRADHLGAPEVPLEDSVRALVEERLGFRPAGAIGLLTHLRYWGYVMNPVSFYYCWNSDGSALEAVVAEVSNTPWGERHCYVLDARRDPERRGSLRFRFAKDFHVSPFMPMDQEYDWRFSVPGERLAVHMENRDGGRSVFDATLAMERRPLNGRSLARALLRYPAMTARVLGAIYLQALRLWLARCPFYPHPKHSIPAKETPR